MQTLAQLTAKINSKLDSLGYLRAPEELYTPIKYALSLGGKRIRPLLTLIACDMFGGNVDDALPAAAGLEMYHNHTLLHDDVMDKADMRRGKPTVHKCWSENAAILSGDAMLILAFKTFSSLDSKYIADVLPLFTETTLQICEGQQYDMEFETRNDVTAEEYLQMIRLKTAVLLAASLKIGAIVGGASKEDADLIYEFGIQIGLAFQLQDDILDVYGDPAVFGKKIGGDIMCDKKTFLLISAVNNASDEDLNVLKSWVGKTSDAEKKIAAVTEVYERTGTRALAEKEMEKCYEKAVACLNKISVSESQKTLLKEVMAKLVNRSV